MSHYKSLDCKAQPKLYNSLLCHGYEKHEIDFIEADIEKLNNLEKITIKYFGAFSDEGLNCTEGGETPPMLGRNHTNESKQLISVKLQGREVWNKGLTKEDPRVAKYIEASKNTQFKEGDVELARKGGQTNKGKKKPPRTQEHIEKIAASKRGIKSSEETKRKQSESHKLRWAIKKGLV